MSAHQEKPIESNSWPKLPLPNTYWVEPGRVLAGEYPAGQSLSITTSRLQALLQAGVTLFVDLTEEGESSSYDNLLDYVTGERPIKHVRYAIPDHKIPASPTLMQNILDTIDNHLASRSQSEAVYVHCRAGIGRTGMTIGCYLARRGLEGDTLLDCLNQLWAESERSRTWPSIPETEVQIQFVLDWAKHDKQTSPLQVASVHAVAPKAAVFDTQLDKHSNPKFDKFCGAILGMAVGDALGALMPEQRGVMPTEQVLLSTNSANMKFRVTELAPGGPLNVPKGTWLADTAMCWCLAESLLARGLNDPEDQMQRYLAWQRDGQYSSTGEALNVPAEVRRALAQWQWSHKPLAGSHDPNNRDAHALTRTLAAVLFFADDATRVLIEAGEVARTTAQSPIVLDANRALATLLMDVMDGIDKETMLAFKRSENAQRLRRNRLKLQVTQVMDGWWRGPSPPARAARDVLAVLSTAIWAFDQSNDFRQGALMAIHGCANAPSAGAAYGALAGAYYGVKGIPREWREALSHAKELTDIATRLAEK